MTSINTSPLSRTVGVLAMAAAVTLMAGCGNKSAPRQMPPPLVGVVEVHAQQIPLVRSATGRLSAYRSADVRARVSGVLLKRTYKEGTHVDKGQVLFQIDPAPLKATLDAAEAALAQAKATYTNAHINAQRARKLAPKGYVSKSDLDNAEAAERTDKAAVQAAKAKVDNARISLGYATVRSPIAGRASKQQVTEGALVGQSSVTLLTTVRQIDPIYVNFSLPVTALQQLRAAQAAGNASLNASSKNTVRITLPDGSVYTHPGKLDFSGISVDPSTSSVSMRALMPNPEHVLLPGMYVNLTIDMGNLHDAYLVPQAAVQRDVTGPYVLVVDAKGDVVRHDVTLHGTHGNDWVVTSGLAQSEKVIVSGIQKAAVGHPAKTQPWKPSGGTAPASAASSAHPAKSAHSAKSE